MHGIFKSTWESDMELGRSWCFQRGCEHSVILARWKEASTYVLRPQIVSVLQFCETSQSGSIRFSEGEDDCDLSQYQN